LYSGGVLVHTKFRIRISVLLTLNGQINAHRYPVWASLARDYLAIMASSVSSERAFSSAGITISKRRNRLKGDIVEALQCLKCMIHKNLIFRFDPTISIADEIAEEDDILADIGDDIEPNSTNKESSSTPSGGWNENWLDLEEADDTEG
jgi:hAT family C-terminal dimerisation region